jgi:hypothetical protein
MLGRFRNRGTGWLLGFWLMLPVLGHLTAPFYILSAPFCRDRSGPLRGPLVTFTVLCAVYVLYITFVSWRVSNGTEWVEPAGDAASLLLTAGLATWVLRGRASIDPGALYQGSVMMLCAVFVLAAIAVFGFGVSRPGLLMKNPLNLSPVLIVPALICTLYAYAPSWLWRSAGALAFFLAVLTLMLLLQARSSALVLVLLALLRVAWILLAEPAPPLQRSRDIAGILLPLVLALGVGALNPQVMQRFGTLAALPVTVQPATPSVPVEADTAPPGRPSADTRPAEKVSTPDAPAEGTSSDIAPSDDTPSKAAHAEPPVQIPVPATSDSSVNQRLAMLQAGWQAFRDAPWLGHGGQNRFAAARPYLPDDFEDFSHLHNDLLTHAVAGGVPAVVLLCLILAFPLLQALRAAHRTHNNIQIALLFCGAFTGTALTNNVLFVDISAFALGLNYVTAMLLITAR